MEAHFRDFIAIHKPFTAEGYTPSRDEVCVCVCVCVCACVT
jgi:hypothetical protein